MVPRTTRRHLLASLAGAPILSGAGADRAPPGAAPRSRLTVNDDGHVFLYLTDGLGKADLRRYLESYCRPGVDTVAFCVGDMSWPTFYPSRVGVSYQEHRAPADLKRTRAYRNLDRLATEPGGYVGAVFRTLRDLGKQALASFRMNDAHFTSVDNPHASRFWKEHAQLALGKVYGYYGGGLDYTHEAVRQHFFGRVSEFAALYPEIDGIELDAMRSPYFFPPGKGPECAPLITELARRIKAALAAQAKRLGRAAYRLEINVPLTPELALDCGLDVAAWEAEGLFDRVSVGTYQAYMSHPVERWKERLTRGTPVHAYINCSPQTGRYLGLEEYRAAAANAYGSGADGIYLFNYPCLLELAMQVPAADGQVRMDLPDLSPLGHEDFTRVSRALDELGRPEALRGKDKRFLYHFSTESRYRHFSPVLPGLDRGGRTALAARLRCYEDFTRARSATLRFKIEHVARGEQFEARINGVPAQGARQQVRYAANGRDTRIHTVALGPFLEYEIDVPPAQLRRGENTLEVAPVRLLPDLSGKIHLVEIELIVKYPA